MRSVLVSTALFGLVSSAFAGDVASPAESVAASGAAVQTTVAPGQPKVICHREMPTGSTIARTVCHTESPQDDGQRAQTQHELADEAQRNRQIAVHSAGG